jgi:hypothetical protein
MCEERLHHRGLSGTAYWEKQLLNSVNVTGSASRPWPNLNVCRITSSMDRHMISRSSRPILEASPTTAIICYTLSQISLMHSIQESSRRPTACLDRPRQEPGVSLETYPLDRVALLTGCDKTTPSDGCCHHCFEEVRTFLRSLRIFPQYALT